MAAGVLSVYPALPAGARHPRQLPGAALPLHHRAGPQPLHRHCGESAGVLLRHEIEIIEIILMLT